MVVAKRLDTRGPRCRETILRGIGDDPGEQAPGFPRLPTSRRARSWRLCAGFALFALASRDVSLQTAPAERSPQQRLGHPQGLHPSARIVPAVVLEESGAQARSIRSLREGQVVLAVHPAPEGGQQAEDARGARAEITVVAAPGKTRSATMTHHTERLDGQTEPGQQDRADQAAWRTATSTVSRRSGWARADCPPPWAGSSSSTRRRSASRMVSVGEPAGAARRPVRSRSSASPKMRASTGRTVSTA